MIDEFNEHHQPIEPEPPLVASDLTRLDVSDPKFQEQLKALEHLEGISARLGTAKPALQTARRVRYELGHIAEPILAMFCADHVYEWHQDKNPHHIDMVMMVCDEHGIEPTPTIIKLAAKIARSRMTGDLSGTPEKLLEENIQGQVFRLMLNLIYAGETLANAAIKAAQWRREHYPNNKKYKASSLDKEYTKRFRSVGPDGMTAEEFHFKVWDRYSTELTKSHWATIKNALPFADDDLLGMRR